MLCSQTCQHFLFISVSVMILEVTSLPGSILNEVCMQISSKQSPFYRRSLFDCLHLTGLNSVGRVRPLSQYKKS